MTEQDIERIAAESTTLYLKYCGVEMIESHFLKYQFAKYLRNVCNLWYYDWEPILDELGCDVSPWHPDNVSMRIVERIIELIKEEQQ